MVDARFHHHGTLTGVEPVSDAAKEWIAENVETEGYQWLGNVLYSEPRYAHLIASAMAAEGLDVEY